MNYKVRTALRLPIGFANTIDAEVTENNIKNRIAKIQNIKNVIPVIGITPPKSVIYKTPFTIIQRGRPSLNIKTYLSCLAYLGRRSGETSSVAIPAFSSSAA